MSYGKAFSPKNIQSGWQKTGIHPFSPEVVLDKFLPKEAIIEQRPSSIKKLTNTIKNLAATNILLKSRIKGYQLALKNEQKKRQRQKPLFQQLAAQENGRAIFYSPKKVQEARELQQQQQDAKEHEAALKADEKLQRQLQKDEKRRLIE